MESGENAQLSIVSCLQWRQCEGSGSCLVLFVTHIFLKHYELLSRPDHLEHFTTFLHNLLQVNGNIKMNLLIYSKYVCEYLLYTRHIEVLMRNTLHFSRWGNISNKELHVAIENFSKSYPIEDIRRKWHWK